MFKYIYVSLVMLVALLAGCDDEKYTIEMTPCDEVIERTLTFSGQLSGNREKRLSELYEEQIDPNTFWGIFSEHLPNDVGGAGFYTFFSTDMGKAFFYSERFRGNDNINYTVEQMQLLVDRSVDFLMGWLEYELGDEPNFDKLWTFCDDNLREDAKNLMLYYWLANILADYKDSATEEIFMRMEHYAVERGYFSPQEIHSFVQSFEGDQEQMLCVLRRVVAQQLGYSSADSAAESLRFLSDGKHAEYSARQYIRTTAFFEEAWEAKKIKENNPYADPPDVNELSINDYILEDVNFPFDIFPSTDHIEVKLICDNEPFVTNGDWEEESGAVVWSGAIARDDELPTFLYALWSEPNEKFQEEHFGYVVLRDEPLSEYCIWRETLDEYMAEEWNTFLLSLRPNEDLEKEISSFRFSDYMPNTEQADVEPTDLAQKGRDLLLAGLKSNKG